jgi:hypothetical protein
MSRREGPVDRVRHGGAAARRRRMPGSPFGWSPARPPARRIPSASRRRRPMPMRRSGSSSKGPSDHFRSPLGDLDVLSSQGAPDRRRPPRRATRRPSGRSVPGSLLVRLGGGCPPGSLRRLRMHGIAAVPRDDGPSAAHRVSRCPARNHGATAPRSRGARAEGNSAGVANGAPSRGQMTTASFGTAPSALAPSPAAAPRSPPPRSSSGNAVGLLTSPGCREGPDDAVDVGERRRRKRPVEQRTTGQREELLRHGGGHPLPVPPATTMTIVPARRRDALSYGSENG